MACSDCFAAHQNNATIVLDLFDIFHKDIFRNLTVIPCSLHLSRLYIGTLYVSVLDYGSLLCGGYYTAIATFHGQVESATVVSTM